MMQSTVYLVANRVLTFEPIHYQRDKAVCTWPVVFRRNRIKSGKYTHPIFSVIELENIRSRWDTFLGICTADRRIEAKQWKLTVNRKVGKNGNLLNGSTDWNNVNVNLKLVNSKQLREEESIWEQLSRATTCVLAPNDLPSIINYIDSTIKWNLPSMSIWGSVGSNFLSARSVRSVQILNSFVRLILLLHTIN